MGDIKEIRDAALAYYHNLSEKQKHEVYTFFQEIDTDGDGTITMEEFEQLFEGSYGDHVNRTFQDLDKNGDGSLDFEESVTLYYSLMTQKIIGCDGCKTPFLKGLYFTCVECFEHNQTTTFDLCTSCYRSRNYVHEHCNFLDNYALLRIKAAYNNSGSTNQPTSSAKSIDGYDLENYEVPRSRSKKVAALKAFTTGVEIGNAVGNIAVATGSCIIM
ncbi:uncharacterized protein LOC133713148 [Rosa rugosa]|uniref:uncharacterized protein LOC133713148 n=1 Tax=Rosa rugosa TaxID=74645 RepID=UPI002B40CD29|nr:uncharacterized protein LOC133713148 [Rosa rugosa]